MSKKLPAIQFYTGDWLKDPELSLCSSSTRGVWMDLLCRMHESGRSGIVTGTVEQLCRLCRATPAEITLALDELNQSRAAIVSERNKVFTIINRRMKEESEERKATADRVYKHRQNKNVTNCNNGVTNPQNNGNQQDKIKKRRCNSNVTLLSSSSVSSSGVFSETEKYTQDSARAPSEGSVKPQSFGEFRDELEDWWTDLHGIINLPPDVATSAQITWFYENKFTVEEMRKFYEFATTDPKQTSWRDGNITLGTIMKGIVSWRKDRMKQVQTNKPSLIDQCKLCDSRGLIERTIDGSKRLTKCKHENSGGKHV
jgi:hypothetical protein